jgi:hypothetical protein
MFYCFNSYCKVPARCERKAALAVSATINSNFPLCLSCNLLSAPPRAADCFAPQKGAFEVSLKWLLLSIFYVIALDAVMK